MMSLNPTKTKQQKNNNVSTTTLTSGLGAKSLFCFVFFFWVSFSRSFGLILMNSGLLIPATSHRVELGAAIFGASDMQRQRHRPCSQNAHLFIYMCLVFKIYLSVHASLELNKLAMNENSSLDVPSFMNRNYTQLLSHPLSFVYSGHLLTWFMFCSI